MKVAINTLAHRTSGGGITYLKNVLPRLSQTEHEFVVFVPESRGVLNDVSASNIEFRQVSLPMTIIPVLLFYEQFVLPYRLRKLDIDVLYSPADIAPLFAPCPVVLAIRNPNPYFTEQVHSGGLRVKFLIQRELTRLSSRTADRVLFVSDFSRSVVNKKLGINDEKCKTIHHGIDPASLKECALESSEVKDLVRQNAPYILSVSTIHRHKNYDCLIRAYAELPEELRSKYPLLIVGRQADEQYYEQLKSLVSTLDIEEDITFTGEIPYADIGCLYREAAVYVLPSKLETFGHTLLEAMTFELPVIAADSTAIPEIAGDAARYFDPDDPGELTAELETVLKNGDVTVQLVEAGRKRIEHFSWDRNVQQLVDTFEEVHER